MFGHEAVLPCEMNIKSLRVAYLNQLTGIQNQDTIMQELRDLNEKIIDALNKLQEEKLQVQKAYNKKVKKQEFMQGDQQKQKTYFRGTWSVLITANTDKLRCWSTSRNY